MIMSNPQWSLPSSSTDNMLSVSNDSITKHNSKSSRNQSCKFAVGLLLAVVSACIVASFMFLPKNDMFLSEGVIDTTTTSTITTKSTTAIPTRNSNNPQTRRRLDNLSDYIDPKSTTTRMDALSFQNIDISTSTSDTTNSDNPMTYNEGAEGGENEPPLPKYTLENILLTLPAYYRELFILLYNSNTDDFSILINENVDEWVRPVRERIASLAPILTHSLRNNFPERFQGTQDFILLFSTGLEPKVVCECLLPETRGEYPDICHNEKFAPILQFGAMYQEKDLLVPNMIPMPTWQYAWCFSKWVEQGEVCEAFLPKKSASSRYGLVYTPGDSGGGVGGGGQYHSPPATEEEAMSQWNALTPQLIWRGSDFGFLTCLYQDIRIPNFQNAILPELKALPGRGKNAHLGRKAHMLETMWDTLTPRWKGVALTDVAEWEATQKGTHTTTAYQLNAMASSSPWNENNNNKVIPWIDVKFTSPKKNTFARYENAGIKVQGEILTLEEMAEYRYHIDFGGGGGTTWAGTIQKLAMPGVLFHHITPTQDWFHPDLRPFVHYIPISTDLSDLESKFKWALENPTEAMKISRAATEYSKYMGTPEYWRDTYEKYFVKSVSRVVDAYVNLEELPEDVKAEMGEVLGRMRVVARCTGRGSLGDCNIDRV